MTKETLELDNERDVHHEWLLHAQLQGHFANLGASAIGNFLNLLVTVCLFAGTAPSALLIAAFVALAGIVGSRYYLAAQLKSHGNDTKSLKRIGFLSTVTAVANGAFWGLFLAALMPYAGTGQQFFIALLGAGMMGGGTMSYRNQSRAGLAYVLGAVPGFLFVFSSLSTGPAIASLACLISYSVFLYKLSQITEHNFQVRLSHTREVSRSAETIQLLLNDYAEQGSDWLFELDSDLKVVRPSDRFANAAQRSVQTLDGKPFASLLDAGDGLGTVLGHLVEKRAFRHQIVSLSIGGEPRWWSISARPVSDANVAWRGVATDITAQKQAEEKVSYMAHYDGLTALPNRFVFSESGYRWLQEDGALALMLLDLDQFKGVNDTLGHITGDRLLRQVAKRLQAATDKADLVCRLGGDEFAILIRKDRMETVDEVAQAIIREISRPFEIEGQSLVIGVSIGISFGPKNGSDIEELVRTGDLALYSAKSSGRNCAVRFDPAMDEAAQQRRRLEYDLRIALSEQQLRLYYQPLIDIETGKPRGYEALVRWAHPERGTVMPGLFIPIAEETGLIIQLGEWVIRQAMEDLVHWDEELTVSVNLSPAQMRSPTLISTVINSLARTGVDARRICLEITESVLLQDSESNLATLHKLRGLGIRIALDDFGTGYSSFNYLRSFPFDKIKIDRSFVSEIDTREDCRAIVRSVLTLARSLGIEITAEGVERPEQEALLREEGCAEVQGFLYSKALPVSELTDLRAPDRPVDARLVRLEDARRAVSSSLETDGQALKAANKG